MKQKISIRDEELQIDLDGDLKPDATGSCTLRVGGAEHDVSLRRSEAARHELVVDGKNVSLVTARDAEGTWVWAAGRAWHVQDVDTGPGRRKKKAQKGGDVSPKTPGVVARILVAVGDQVEAGQELVVVSAMKMEMPLVAGTSGIVRAIKVEVGANVRPGELLVEIEEDPGPPGGKEENPDE
jgi:biotin carboxyl carrier protein